MSPPDRIWAPAESPQQPPHADCELVDVADAVMTPYQRGPLSSTLPPASWISGAVHDSEGRLVPTSQRMWTGDANAPVPADPERVSVPSGAKKLAGSWIYGGHWSGHFGHFLLETLTNLWPDPRAYPVAGIVLHRRMWKQPRRSRLPLHSPDLATWQQDLLDLAGYGGLEVRVVHGRPVRVERLLVPTRPVSLHAWARPPAVAVWQRVSATVGDRGDETRLFLSRSLFHLGAKGWHVRSEAAWDDLLDTAFSSAGFAVVHPERLTVAEQVRLARGARVIASPSGSALHHAAFAAPGIRVLEIGDRRNRDTPLRTQRVINAACGHLSGFVPHEDEAALMAALASLAT